MVFAFSKAFGPTVSTTGSAEKQIGSDYIIPPKAQDRPGPFHIEKIRIGKSSITAGGEVRHGLVYIKTGSSGTYEYAYGQGSGEDADASSQCPAEEIDCSIPADSGGKCQVFVKDFVDAADVTVSLEFHYGLGPRIDSYGAIGSDTAADTEESMGTKVMDKAGKIIQIRFVGMCIGDGESATAIIELIIPGLTGPFEFAVGNGHGGDTIGHASEADVIKIKPGIPVGKNVTIDMKITSADIMKAPHYSIAVA